MINYSVYDLYTSYYEYRSTYTISELLFNSVPAKSDIVIKSKLKIVTHINCYVVRINNDIGGHDKILNRILKIFRETF